MKISVTENARKPFHLNLPTRLVFNSLTALFATVMLRKELYRYIRNHPEWCLAEIDSTDASVIIKL